MFDEIIEKFKRYRVKKHPKVDELTRDEKISLLEYVESGENKHLLLALSKYMLENDFKFQTIYKGVVWNGGYDNIEEAVECYNDSIKRGSVDERCYSIEVILPRDKKENSRATLKELCEEYQNKEYEKAIKKVEELTELVEQMRKALL